MSTRSRNAASLTDAQHAPADGGRQSTAFAGQPRPASPTSLPPRILHAEDNATVADAVRETLEESGWSVETCADGSEARRRLAGREHFDLLVFDNDLPDLGGLELIRQARRLPRRCLLPIIMLSAANVEAQARLAGADAFLRKPQDIGRLADTVARLLGEDNS